MILALVYYHARRCATWFLNGVVRSVQDLTMTAGDDYDVVAVSFDPRETPEMAARQESNLCEGLRPAGRRKGLAFPHRAGSVQQGSGRLGWLSLCYDSMTNQYAHASAIMILTPEGTRGPLLLRHRLSGARRPAWVWRKLPNGHIGSAVDQVLLYCYHYDPANGKYGLVIMNVMRLGGLLTVVCAGGISCSIRCSARDFRRRRRCARMGIFSIFHRAPPPRAGQVDALYGSCSWCANRDDAC